MCIGHVVCIQKPMHQWFKGTRHHFFDSTLKWKLIEHTMYVIMHNLAKEKQNKLKYCKSVIYLHLLIGIIIGPKVLLITSIYWDLNRLLEHKMVFTGFSRHFKEFYHYGLVLTEMLVLTNLSHLFSPLYCMLLSLVSLLVHGNRVYPPAPSNRKAWQTWRFHSRQSWHCTECEKWKRSTMESNNV